MADANTTTSDASIPSKLPTSRLRKPATSRFTKKKSLEGPKGDGKEDIKPKNPLLDRVTKKKTRRSIGLQRGKAVVNPIKRNPISTARATSAGKTVTKPLTSTSRGPATKSTTTTTRKPLKHKAPENNSGPAESKKPKRSAWDYKGQLEDMKEAFQQQKTALAEEKNKASQMDDVLRRLEALETEKQESTGMLQSRNEELSTLRNDNARMVDEHAREIRRLQDDREREMRTLRIDLEDTRRELRKAQDENDELGLKLRSAKRDLAENVEKLSNAENELKELREKCAQLEQQNSEYSSTIEKQDEDLKSQEIDRKKLLNEVQELKGNIRVFCRVRPTIKDEEAPNHITYEGQKGKSLNVVHHEKKSEYNFDKVFDSKSTQAEVYEELDQLVQSSLDGYNVCVFAYGQTGSGKTYTMEGPDELTEETCGIIPRAMKQIFQKCQEMKKLGWNYELRVEHVEIYCETLQDLLRKGNSSEKLEIRTKTPKGRDVIWVPNLSNHKVEKYNDVMKLLKLSKSRRATAATSANDHSSRSHSVFMLKIKATNEMNGQEADSTLNLIDLAGSERCGDNGATGQRLKEGKKINGSLTALSCVISALANKESHIPYRNSKLTLLLTNSLGGNSKTLMVVNINPSPTASSETINTLRFATTVNQCNIGTAQKMVKF